MYAALREASRVIADGKRVVLIIGGSRRRGIPIPASAALCEMAESVGLELVQRIVREVPGRILVSTRDMTTGRFSSRPQSDGIAYSEEDILVFYKRPVQDKSEQKLKMDEHMKESNFPQPSSEQLVGFQEGDPLVANEIVELVLPSILRWAWTRYKLLLQDDVQDIVHQVLAETCHHYVCYDLSRGVLFTTYVIGLLKLRLADLYATQQEKGEKEDFGPHSYEKLLSSPYNDTEALDEDTRIVREEFYHQVEEHLEPVERELFQLMRKDVKSTKAVVILVRYGPVSDEEREVKNAKARLVRKVIFIAKTLGYAPEDLR